MVSSNPTCGCGEDAICNETELKCDPCCRCIPQRLCATFESYGCDCDGSSAFLPLDSDGQYTGELICGVEVVDLTVLLHSENDKCYWRVVSEKNYIDELFEIGPELQSCERPELILPFSFAECGGTLTITRHELRKLPARLDNAGCPSEPFCGDCKCAFKCLCVSINTIATPYHPGNTQYLGEICDVASPFDGPTWEGVVGDYRISLSLGPDDYGQCVINGFINGEEVTAAEILDCHTLAFTITTNDGTEFTVSAKQCGCARPVPPTCICDRFLGTLLYGKFKSGNSPSVFDVVLNYVGQVTDLGIKCPQNPDGFCLGYSGRYCGNIPRPMGGSRYDCIDIRLVCDSEFGGWILFTRFDSRVGPDTAPYYGWCIWRVWAADCECPATIVMSASLTDLGDCASNDYQISQYLFEEAVENCL